MTENLSQEAFIAALRAEADWFERRAYRTGVPLCRDITRAAMYRFVAEALLLEQQQDTRTRKAK